MDGPSSWQSKRPRVSEEHRKRAVRAYVSPDIDEIESDENRCDGCRRVKEKCEGGVPCRRCVRYRRQCIFTHPEPRSTYVPLFSGYG